MADPTSSSSSTIGAEGGHDVDTRRKPQQQKKASHWELVYDQTHVTPEVLNWPYKGSGTEEDPYVVEYIENDRRNPMLFPQWKKWTITILVAFATLAVAFVSAAYSGGIEEILAQFHIGDEVAVLGISLFVLGFAIGPLLWAPMSELFGRQVLFIGTYAALTAFNAGAAGAQNIQTLIILRFFAGAFGSSPLTNAGGVIADMFPASQRGMAMSVFAAAPFLGPVLGPIIGGFLGETEGWRWVEGLMAIFTGALWIIGAFTIPETYSPVILRRRAAKLSKMTGKVYKSKMEIDQGTKTVKQEFKIALSRPWILLFREPIVLLLSIYMAIIYGTLYMMFAAFPIVYQQGRGWSPGIGGLSFIGVMVGEIIAVAYSIWDNKRYEKVEHKHKGNAPPEARLPPAMVGSIFLPLGLFWFAWTNYPSIHWSVSIIATAPFGFGMVLVFLSIMNYLIDSYVIYAASVLAANSVLRSLFGAAFPLFTTYMYQNLGIHWASSIPAFLALMCVPFPFLFYKYGKPIRMKCKFAAEAARVLAQIKGGDSDTAGNDEEEGLEVPDEEMNPKKEEGGEVNTSLGAEPKFDEDMESRGKEETR
ncbi:MFS general substrate transporter [Mollisia scopiformis]|uniref:MFS general substrate transporter n=1 Tax=Mollisia scopiformis TaxID=149040 RepID=A0A194XLJ0_MOLSC|nr:MFS general substrate transporter [Mollisia scopiformis]KUJ20949.1 MFS general substrate transporter [Mollisia scopiformis]